MKKITICFLLIAFLNYLACTTMNVVSKHTIKEEVKVGTIRNDLYIVTKDNSRYHFGSWGYRIESDTLYGKGLKINLKSKEPFEGKIALDDISYFEMEEGDAIATVGLVVGTAAIVLLAVTLIFTSAITSEIVSGD